MGPGSSGPISRQQRRPVVATPSPSVETFGEVTTGRQYLTSQSSLEPFGRMGRNCLTASVRLASRDAAKKAHRLVRDGFGGGRCGGAAPAQGRPLAADRPYTYRATATLREKALGGARLVFPVLGLSPALSGRVRGPESELRIVAGNALSARVRLGYVAAN